MQRLRRYNNHHDINAIIEHAYSLKNIKFINHRAIFNIMRCYPKNLRNILIYFQIALKKKTYTQIGKDLKKSTSSAIYSYELYKLYLDEIEVRDEILNHIQL